MKIDFFSPKKYLWPYNALVFNLYKLRKGRNPKLWVFGAWEGRKYDDNARALFEYLHQNHRNVARYVWLACNEQVILQVRSLGYEAYLADSDEGKNIQKEAGVAIYTNGLMDFGLHPKVGGALIVSLWHGVGFKKTYNEKYHGIKLLIKTMMDKIFSWTYRNMTVAPSQYVIKQFSGIFGLNQSHHFAITGQPRNDIFKKHLSKKTILSKVDIDYTKNIILYMPTYCSNGLPETSMADIIQNLYDSKELQTVLKKTGSIFVAKLHPLTKHINIRNRDNFVILDNLAVESTQSLMAVSDILITDYSSCIVDFALQKKPVIFYTPDHEEFIAKSEPIYDEFFEICKTNNSSTPKDLAKKIENPSMRAVDAINNLYEDKSIEGTCYSENVYNVIINNLRWR